MNDYERGGLLRLLVKSARTLIEEEVNDSATEVPDVPRAAALNKEPMKAYWETDIEELERKQVPVVDLFVKNLALERIPDSTSKPVIESHYDFDRLSSVFLPQLTERLTEKSKILANTPAIPGVTEGVPKTTTSLSNSGRDAGVVAGIVVAVITGVIILAALIAVVMYRHYVHRNVTSMNFDNPVYRKTTEDQFALEKNGYAPGSKLYPSTVGEEAQEPLNTPGTNDFV